MGDVQGTWMMPVLHAGDEKRRLIGGATEEATPVKRTEWEPQVLSIHSHLYSFLPDTPASIKAAYLVVLISNSLVYLHGYP